MKIKCKNYREEVEIVENEDNPIDSLPYLSILSEKKESNENGNS